MRFWSNKKARLRFKKAKAGEVGIPGFEPGTLAPVAPCTTALAHHITKKKSKSFLIHSSVSGYLPMYRDRSNPLVSFVLFKNYHGIKKGDPLLDHP